VEGDFTWPNLTEHSILAPATGLPGVNNHTFLAADTRNNWLASARARLGVVGWNTLWYVTGGGAWTQESYAGVGQFFNGFNDSATGNRTRSGWVAGAGAEYMINPNWLLRVEYLYYKFESGAFSAGFPWNGPTPFGVANPLFTWANNYNIQAVRFGASYKF
jgi:outer membrane immunogenic protein